MFNMLEINVQYVQPFLIRCIKQPAQALIKTSGASLAHYISSRLLIETPRARLLLSALLVHQPTYSSGNAIFQTCSPSKAHLILHFATLTST